MGLTPETKKEPSLDVLPESIARWLAAIHLACDLHNPPDTWRRSTQWPSATAGGGGHDDALAMPELPGASLKCPHPAKGDARAAERGALFYVDGPHSRLQVVLGTCRALGGPNPAEEIVLAYGIWIVLI
jgi:hypothetical protein